MGVDLHRIGTGISSGSSRNGFNSIVAFPSVVAPSFPANGSYNSTLYGVEYPVAHGGTEVSIDNDGTTYYFPNQTCDVTVVNDGFGGVYTAWGTASNIQYKDSYQPLVTFTTNLTIMISTSCSGEQGPFSNGNSFNAYNHNGMGGYYGVAGGTNYPWANSSFTSESCSYDDGMGNYYTYNYSYYADGNGGYYTYTS